MMVVVDNEGGKLLVVELDYLLDSEVFVFSLCLYPMNTLHPRRMYTPPCGGVQGGLPPLQGPGKAGPQRKNCLVNVYCNFIVNLDRSL
jgi:hypothetical protein